MNIKELERIFFETEPYKDLADNNYHSLWKKICHSKDPYLTEEFMEKYKDKMIWNLISAHQKLSEQFIEVHKNEVNWYFIAKYQKLSGEFIFNFKQYIWTVSDTREKDWYCSLSKNNKINLFKYMMNKDMISQEAYLKRLLEISSEIIE